MATPAVLGNDHLIQGHFTVRYPVPKRATILVLLDDVDRGSQVASHRGLEELRREGYVNRVAFRVSERETHADRLATTAALQILGFVPESFHNELERIRNERMSEAKTSSSRSSTLSPVPDAHSTVSIDVSTVISPLVETELSHHIVQHSPRLEVRHLGSRLCSKSAEITQILDMILPQAEMKVQDENARSSPTAVSACVELGSSSRASQISVILLSFSELQRRLSSELSHELVDKLLHHMYLLSEARELLSVVVRLSAYQSQAADERPRLVPNIRLPRQSFEFYRGVDLSNLDKSDTSSSHQWTFAETIWYHRGTTRVAYQAEALSSSIAGDSVNALHLVPIVASTLLIVPKYGD